MTRRDFIRTSVAVSASALAAPLMGEGAGTEMGPMNVLFVMTDQHNADFMGCAGHALVKTPNLDALAASGVRFSRAYCQDGICVPSRTSIMTGLYPRTTGCLDNPNRPVHPERFLMLQHLLKQSGYRTGCFGKRHLPRAGEMALGWDSSATTINPKQDPSDENYWDWIRERGKWDAFERDWKGAHQSDLGSHVSDLAPEERDAAYTARKTLAFLRECSAEKAPFFCWAAFHGPHQPYTPPAKWTDLYPVDSIPLPENVNQPVEDLPPMLQNWRRNTRPPWNLAKAAEHPDIYRRYAGCYMGQVTEIDHYLGEILRGLDNLQLRDSTLILYTSDHGDFVGRHGMVEKCAVGHNVYEDTLRAPLIISWPERFRQGVERSDLVELIDIYPTIVDALGLERPAEALPLQGRSLVPALTQDAPVGRDFAVSENWSQVTVIGLRHKLGVWIDTPAVSPYDKRNWRGKTPDLLFDRAQDPHEVTNLIGRQDYADVEAHLTGALEEWTTDTSDAGKREWVQQNA